MVEKEIRLMFSLLTNAIMEKIMIDPNTPDFEIPEIDEEAIEAQAKEMGSYRPPHTLEELQKQLRAVRLRISDLTDRCGTTRRRLRGAFTITRKQVTTTGDEGTVAQLFMEVQTMNDELTILADHLSAIDRL